MATTCSESPTVKTSPTLIVESSPPSSAPPNPAIAPASANDCSFVRAGETVYAAADVGVVAYADHGAADAGATQPRDEDHRRA